MSNIFSNLEPFPFRQYSWAVSDHQFDNYYDNDYLYEHTRITNSICVALEWATSVFIDKSVNICSRINTENPSRSLEAVIGLVCSPWYRRWVDYETLHDVTLDPWDRTTIYDVGNYSGIYDGLTVFEAELQFFQDKLEVIMGYLADANEKYGANVRIGAFLPDTEKFRPRLNLDNEDYLNGTKELYDAIQTRLISTLQGNPSGNNYEMDGVDIIWYLKGMTFNNYNSSVSTPEEMTFVDKVYFTGRELPSLATCADYYKNSYEWIFDEIIKEMNSYVSHPSVNTHVYEDKIVPYFSLCAGYEIPPVVPTRTWNNFISYQTIGSYKLGRKMNKDGDLYRNIYATTQYPAPFADTYDELSDSSDPSAEFTWVDHFIEYAKGVNDVDNNITAVYNGSSVTVNPDINNFRFYLEETSDEATISVEGVDYTIGENDGNLVWDKDGENYEFSFVGESISRTVILNQVIITYTGEGSHLFSVEYLLANPSVDNPSVDNPLFDNPSFDCAWLGIDSTYLLAGGAGVGYCGEEAGAELSSALDGTKEWEHETDHVHWFILDLGDHYSVEAVRGRSDTNIDPVNVEIYISGNTTDWTSIATLNTWQDTTEWVVEATIVKKGRYIKVEIQTTQDLSTSYIGFGSSTLFQIFDVCATLDSSSSSRSSSSSLSSSSNSSSSLSSSLSSVSSSSSSLSSSSSNSSSNSSSSSSTSIYTDIINEETVICSQDTSYRFSSVDTNTCTIIIDGVSFVVKNEDNLLVWDNNSKINIHTFTYIDQKIYRKAGRFYILITYIGTGSLLFSIEFITFYKMTADIISNSQDRGESISSDILQMRNDLENSEVDDDNIDKKWVYEETNRTYGELNIQHNNYSREVLNFVQKLQEYIVSKYSSVNTFLRDTNTTVLPTFSIISGLVGYTIDDDLIASEESFCQIS